jgi:hypothetical protein
MTKIVRKLGLVVGLIAAIAIAWSQISLALAAPMPKVGVAYQTTGGALIDASNYTVVADMVVPAGKYQVTASGIVNNQTGVPVNVVACNAYGATTFVFSGTTSAPMQYAAIAISGTVDLPSGGTIKVECISDVSAGPFPNVGMSLVAQSVAGISLLP